SFTVEATDPDVPPNNLTYRLTDAPAGATLDPVSGSFEWTPTPSQTNSTNVITVTVTDDGPPNLSASASFTVIVAGPPVIESITSTEGGVELVWVALPGRSYRAEWKLTLEDSSWNELAGDVQAQGTTATKTDNSTTEQTRFYRVLALP